MDWCLYVSKENLGKQSRIREIHRELLNCSDIKSSSYKKSKGRGSYKFSSSDSDKIEKLEGELKSLKLKKSRVIILDLLKDLLKENFSELSFKVVNKKGSYSIKVYLFFKGINFIEFSLYDSHLGFKLTNELIYGGIFTFENIILKRLYNRKDIKGINFNKNKPLYIALNDKMILLSVNRIDYTDITTSYMVYLINYFVDTVIPVFNNSYYYLNKTTNEVEFFICNMEDNRIYVRDISLNKKNIKGYFCKELNKNFTSLKKNLGSKIPRIKKESSRNYRLVES